MTFLPAHLEIDIGAWLLIAAFVFAAIVGVFS